MTSQELFDKAKVAYKKAECIVNKLSQIAYNTNNKFNVNIPMKQYDLIVQALVLYIASADGKMQLVEVSFAKQIARYDDILEYVRKKRGLSLDWESVSFLDENSAKQLAEICGKLALDLGETFVSIFGTIDAMVDDEDFISELTDATMEILGCAMLIDGNIDLRETLITTTAINRILVEPWNKYKNLMYSNLGKQSQSKTQNTSMTTAIETTDERERKQTSKEELRLEGKKFISTWLDGQYIKFESGYYYNYDKNDNGRRTSLLGAQRYTIKDNTFKIESHRDTNIVDGDYLFSSSYEMEGLVPEKSRFNSEFVSTSIIYEKRVFNEDGTYYIEDKSGRKKYEGVYIRNGNIIVTSDRKTHYWIDIEIMYIYHGKLYEHFYVLDTKYEEFEAMLPSVYWERKREREEREKQKRELEETLARTDKLIEDMKKSNNSAPWDTHYYNSPCPWCGKYKVRPAKWEDKKLSVSFWGVFSPKTAARYKCDACKEMWE